MSGFRFPIRIQYQEPSLRKNRIRGSICMQFYLFRGEEFCTAISVAALGAITISDELGEPCFDLVPVAEEIVLRLVLSYGGRVIQ